LFKTIIPFYIICLGLYISFSRRPDFQDGEFATGIIHYIKDSTGKSVPKAIFSTNKINDTVNAGYPLRTLNEGQQVNIIYETSDPSKGAVYSWWGYWIQPGEILASVLIPLVFLFVAKAITSSPTPEAVIEEIEMSNPPTRENY